MNSGVAYAVQPVAGATCRHDERCVYVEDAEDRIKYDCTLNHECG